MTSVTLLPTSDESSSGTIVYSSGATAWNLLDDDDGNTNTLRFDSDGFVSLNYSDMPSALSVSSVSMTASYSSAGAFDTQKGRLFVKIGGTKYYGGYNNLTTSTAYGTITYSWTLNPATSQPWTNVEVNALIAGFEMSNFSANSELLSYVAVAVEYTPMPAAVAVVRHISSVDLWLKRRPQSFGTWTHNLDALNVGLLGAVDVEHTAGPHATGAGWEDEVWERRPFAIHSLSIDQDAFVVRAEIKDQRPILCLVRDLAWSDKSSGNLGDGIARFMTPGATATFTRASEHTFTNPVGESESVPTDIAAYGLGGLYMLSASGGRAAPRYYYSNNSGARTWNAAQGTFQCEVNLAAVSGVANQAVAYCFHDASNSAYLYWDGAAGAWKFAVRVAGVTVTASKSASPSSSTWYQIGARWTGSNTELGATAYTVSVWVDRVKGTDATAAAAMTQAASSNLDIGTKAGAGTEQLNGQIRKIHSYQHVLTDVEMTRAI